jgi:hypothetical protein
VSFSSLRSLIDHHGFVTGIIILYPRIHQPTICLVKIPPTNGEPSTNDCLSDVMPALRDAGGHPRHRKVCIHQT